MKKKIALYGVMIALALIMSFVESMIPMPIAIPGIKIGLANIVIVFALYSMGEKQAIWISICRIILSSFLFGSMAAMLYSLGGAVVSLGTMCLFKKTKWFSLIGISVIGGVMHNVGQITVAIFITSFKTILFYIPFLLLAGVITGLMIGIIANEVKRRIPNIPI